MTPGSSRRSTSWQRRASLSAILVACFAWPALSGAQSVNPPPRDASRSLSEQGVRWNDLKPAQQATLKPLERQWAAISPPQKQKWLELSSRFPKLTLPEQARVQERMVEWARLTPQQRGQARLNFEEAKQLPAQDRQARWNAYQALSPEQKQQLAARAAPAAGPSETARKAGSHVPRTDKPTREALPQPKSNLVPNPAFAAPPKAIEPTVVQARPGATTTLITKRPSPPSHQQTGLPKIAATPGFVDKATLLPQRGPQGAATRSASSAPEAPAQR